MHLLSFLLAIAPLSLAAEHVKFPPASSPLAEQYNCSLKLAFTPSCTSFTSATFGNANQGINLRKIKNVVPFGDSWTAMNDSVGAYPPPPAVIVGTNPMAGERAANGPTWTEYIANDTSAEIHPYAVGGAVTNLTIWPTAIARNIPISSFVNQTKVFVGQNRSFDPESSLYIIFFGINDHTYSLTDGQDRMLLAADSVNFETQNLIAAGARNILTAGVYFNDTGIPGFENSMFTALQNLASTTPGLNIGFVNFFELWTAILDDPTSFGYTNTSMCLPSDSTTVGACASPQTFLYWQHAHPSTCSHRLMADFTEYVLTHC